MSRAKIVKDLGSIYKTKSSKYRRHCLLVECSECKQHRVVANHHHKTSGSLCVVCKNKMFKKMATKHNMSKTKIHNMWISMRSRCHNQNTVAYKYYGGRGISVCNEWDEYSKFLEFAIFNGYKDGLELDRIDNDGNYEPNNCQFITHKNNSRKTRKIRSNNTSGYRGVSMTRSRKWESRITVDGKQIFFGVFETAIDAAKARDRYIYKNSLLHTVNFSDRSA